MPSSSTSSALDVELHVEVSPFKYYENVPKIARASFGTEPSRLEVNFLDLSRSVTFATDPVTKSTRGRVSIFYY